MRIKAASRKAKRKEVEKAGFREGDELSAEAKGNKIVLKRK